MTPPPKLLDLDSLENLRALSDHGDDSFLREIVGIYLEDVPRRIADLRTARDADDRPLYVRSAHTMKGSSASVGAAEMQALAAELEQRAKVDPLPSLDNQLNELEHAFGRTAQALRTFLG